jgi:hypothetical protein
MLESLPFTQHSRDGRASVTAIFMADRRLPFGHAVGRSVRSEIINFQPRVIFLSSPLHRGCTSFDVETGANVCRRPLFSLNVFLSQSIKIKATNLYKSSKTRVTVVPLAW